MEEFKKQWLPRALIGGAIGAALMLALVWVLDAMPWMSHIWHFRNPFAVWAEWLIDGSGWPGPSLPNLCLAILAGAEVGWSILPVLLLYAAVGGAVVIGVLAAAAQRLREIDGGEEDEASKY